MNSKSGRGTSKLEADIVIIGGGGGGLAAAAAAAEKGVKKIIVVEKLGRLGGFSAMAHGIFACESPVQKREMIDCRADDCFKIHMNWAHWGRVDPRVIRAFLNKSGDTIRWLEGQGLQFTLRTVYPNQLPVWHNPQGLGAQIIKTLAADCEKWGVKILLKTSGRKILRSAKGDISGVMVADETGKEIEIKSKNVIVSTGGFGGNKSLLKQYCPNYYDEMYIDKIAAYHTGDGLLMAAEIGAAIAETIPLLALGHRPDTPSRKAMPLAAITEEPYTVWVNKQGRRFADESSLMAINAIFTQPDKITFAIFDDQIRQRVEAAGVIVGHAPPDLEKAQRQGMPAFKEVLQTLYRENLDALKIADSWEEAAGWIGAAPETLKETMDEYNTACDRGHDRIFVKDPHYLWPLRQPPYYIVRCSPGFHDTMGGIKVTDQMQVRDAQDNVIPGLFAAGVLPDGWESDIYCWILCGSAFSFAINSGRIAGESAARRIL